MNDPGNQTDESTRMTPKDDGIDQDAATMVVADQAVECTVVPELSSSGGLVGDDGQPSGRSWNHAERYRDESQLGRGGMGTVRRTFDRVLMRRVALKAIEPSVASSHVGRLFVEEAQITGQLDHPNIVPVYDLGRTGNDEPFFTMKMVTGQTLAKVVGELHRDGLASEALERVIRILIKVCEAVGFAHSRGVVHRDLKPANIMIGSHGQVYVMDWGLAVLVGRTRPSDEESSEFERTIRTSHQGKLTTAGVAGTVAYMAPEQASGRIDKIDGRTDVFALGAILYHVLTGRAPYMADSYVASLEQAKRRSVVPPQELVASDALPPGLCDIAMKAMALRHEERHQSAEILARDLERFLRGGGWLKTLTYAAGDVIIREGEAADAGYVIIEGRCEVFQMRGESKVVLRQLEAGSVFGETAILSSQPRTASVAALDRVVVKVVTPEAFERELGGTVWVGALVKQLTARFIELEAKLRDG